MANQDAAFGLKPIGFLGSTPMNSGLTEFEVAACASAFSQNDLMKVINTGTVGIAAATDNGALLGSAQGVFFTDATTSKPTFANNLRGSNAATDIKALSQTVRTKCTRSSLTTVVHQHKLTCSTTLT